VQALGKDFKKMKSLDCVGLGSTRSEITKAVKLMIRDEFTSVGHVEELYARFGYNMVKLLML
jgi:hypothetical protein